MSRINTITSGQVTVKAVFGDVTVAEVIATIREFYERGATKYLVWDFRHGSLQQLEAADLMRIRHVVTVHAHKRAGGKTAIIAPNAVDFGLGRVADAYGEVENLPIQIRTFRSAAEAVAWLEVEELPS